MSAYRLPDGLRPAGFLALLAERVPTQQTPAGRLLRAYYDTFDGRLHGAGLTLEWSGGRLAARDGDGVEVAGADVGRVPETVRAADLPALADVLDVRTATRLAKVRVHRWALSVLDGERKTVVRLELEDAGEPIAPRLYVRPVRGYDKARRRLIRVLERDLGLEPVTDTLADEAVTAAGGAPGGVSSKLDLQLDGRERADTAAVLVARRLLEVIEANLPGALADIDSEFVHDLRVAVRRTRALQRELRGVFPADELQRHRDGFKWLQQVTGPVRDLDVHLLELPEDDAELAALRQLLTEELRRERRKMVRALRSDRTRELLDGWRALLADLGDRPDDDRPEAAKPLHKVAGKRIHRVYGHMVRMGCAIDDDSPHEALHDLRKKGKELRYLLEFFGGAFPQGEVKPMVKTLKALQDVLGTFQDREVQADTLRALGEKVASRPDGAAALMAMGVTVARLEVEQHEARAEFAEVFGPFASKARRKAVKEAFR